MRTQVSERESCKLCEHDAVFVCDDKRRAFYLCNDCGLIFVPEKFWLTVDEERARYDLHDNSLDNAGYKKYLSQVVDVVNVVDVVDVVNDDMKSSPKKDIKILDYGCGENAVLCKLLNDVGYDCVGYDPLYNHILNDDVNVKYDIVILCEVIEHLRDINKVFAQIKNLLNDDGSIIIRTQLYNDISAFPNWWYAQDLTHINFFNQQTLSKLAMSINKKITPTEFSDIFIFGKMKPWQIVTV